MEVPLKKLSGDESIREVIGSLAKPEAYARGVLGNMAEFKPRDIKPIVRIGTTGQGIYPHYRIESAHGDGSDILGDLNASIETMTAFNGRNHKAMDWTPYEIRGEHWSDGLMTFDEVQTLLGELRRYKGKRGV